jgi:hypothetical protein
MAKQSIMSRLNPIEPKQASKELQAVLNESHITLEEMPNFLKVLANSGAALKAYVEAEILVSRFGHHLPPLLANRRARKLAPRHKLRGCARSHELFQDEAFVLELCCRGKTQERPL